MAVHLTMLVAFFFWRTTTLLTHVLVDNHCTSYIIFCCPEESAVTFLNYLCNKVTVKQDPTSARCFARAAAAYRNAIELERYVVSVAEQAE